MTRDYEALRQQRLQQVDPQYRELIERWPHLREIGVEGMRTLLAGIPAGESAPGVVHHDVDVPGPAGPVPTRVFAPAPTGSDEPLGVVVNIHAGGFVGMGGLDTTSAANSRMAAATGCVVVAPDFRLPPEHRFPAAVEDCWAVVQWVETESAAAGWDVDRIAVGGGCTGGNIAAVMALMARDAGSPRLALQFPWSWPADARADTPSQHEFADGYGLRRDDNLFVFEQYLDDPEQRWDWRASPLLAESVAGVAPAVITVGEWDILRDEDRMYGDRLRDAGVRVTFNCLPGQGHLPRSFEELSGILYEAIGQHVGPEAAQR
jgi:acetyl esterase